MKARATLVRILRARRVLGHEERHAQRVMHCFGNVQAVVPEVLHPPGVGDDLGQISRGSMPAYTFMPGCRLPRRIGADRGR